MDINNFNAAITARGFVPAGNNIFCGTYKDLPLWVSPVNKQNPVFTVGISFLLTPSNQYLKAVQARVSEIATVKLVIKNDANAVSMGSFICKVQAKDKAADFGFVLDAALQALVGEMAQANLTISKACAVCGRQDCDSYGYYRYFYRPVHAACAHSASQQAQVNIQKNESKSYIIGALGALLGAIVGSLPTILVLAFVGIISGWLCALIPFAAYTGYNLLGGKRTKLTILFVILASVIVVPFVVYATTAIELYQVYQMVLSPDIFMIYLFSDGIGFLLQVLLFTGLGILFSLGSIVRNSKNDLGGAACAVATLRPISNNVSNSSVQPAQPADMPQ